MTGRAFVVADRETWLAQARRALDELEAAGLTVDGVAVGNLDEALAADNGAHRQAVADLLQAFDALDVNVAPDLMRRAGLVDLGEELER